MLDGIPGTPFDGDVVIRRLRWASEETGFGVIDADWQDDEIVLVGTIAHLEERERARVSGVWQEDRRYGMQVKVALAEPLPPSGDAALTAYLVRVKHVGRVRAAQAAGALRRRRPGRDRPRPGARVPGRRAEPAAHERGDQVLARRCARPARCTCCWRRTASPGSCRAWSRSTATARSRWSAAARTT